MSKKTLKIIIQILLLFVIAIVPFLKTGFLYFPYVSGKAYVFRLLVMLAFFFWIWLGLKEKKYRPNLRNLLIVTLILFFLAQALVSFFGVDPLLSFFSTMERMDGVLQYGFWLVYFLMLISVFKKEQDWKLFFSVFVITAILVSIYALFHLKEQVRVHANLGNSSYLAVFLLFAIGFGFIVLERKFFKNIFLRVFLFLVILLFIITLIFTQTRGAYLGLVAGILLFCLLAFLSPTLRIFRNLLRVGKTSYVSSGRVEYPTANKVGDKKLALSCGIILFLGLISIVVLFAAKDTNFVQNTYILKRATSVAKLWEDDTVRERLLVWQIALKAFKEKPIFGWGPENFGSAVNKYYDYRVGIIQPWFDRAHSQPIDTLATGGIILFSFYLLWLATVVYVIFRISREKKILSFILASIFLAYFLQGLFLFDILPTYLGLFPFLAFLVFQFYELRTGTNIRIGDASRNHELKERQETRYKIQTTNHKPQATNYKILIPTGIFSLFIIWATVFIPYKANVLAIEFLVHTNNGIYRGTKQFLEKSFAIKSPYTFWELRKRSGWQFGNILKYELEKEVKPEDVKALKEIYDYITPELEKFAENRPYDHQIYYILGRIYLLGFEKLGKNDLDKAEIILKKGFNYSETRIEYYTELVRVLILEKKFEEVENLIKEYSKKLSSNNEREYYDNLILGHLYVLAERNDLAWEQYERAREAGYQFVESDLVYSRYAFLAEERGEYQKVVDISLVYLEKWGPDADIFYNVAVGYLNLGEKEKSKEFFLKALELNSEYEEYLPLFK